MALRFTQGNAKLGKNTLTFNLPAGHACPFARLCLARADRKTGKVTDGPEQEFRCYGASCECRYPSMRKMVWANYDQLLAAKTAEAMADLIDRALTPWLRKLPDVLIRIHSTGGDFFNAEYFKAWCIVASRHPGRQKDVHGMRTDVHGMHVAPEPEGVICYAYTKALPFMLLKRPDNLRLVASRGGTHDRLIEEHCLREARVCMTEEEAASKGLGCDPLDDSHAWAGSESFALIIHGMQQAGSDAGKAIVANRKAGRFAGYSAKKN